ncbi:MAG TPA: serine/threonine-protein kinase [Solirubrobacteraceae bacterium]|nr:serine/threonine-protein kinase [Solirubrobacteraceae bacterium]
MPIAPDLRGTALDGRYELRELIGEGAFGRVYRGHDRRLEREVAIKVVKPWWAEDPEWVAVFEREARLLARVNHPGIVQIHDVGQCADGLYYVSELVVGEDLAARLCRAGGAGLDPAAARSLALGLCEALAGAHAAGIVHRDVKPANVLIVAGRADDRVDRTQRARGGAGGTGNTGAGSAGTATSPARVKVADFGVARLAESTEDGPSLIVGTPRYMAPEQADGGPVTPATDVYAIGAILYEMLAGRPPFDGRTAVELAVRHREDPLSPLPAHVARVEPALARAVETALAKRPEDRYPDAGAMARALQDAGGGRSGRVAGNLCPPEQDKPSPRRQAEAAEDEPGPSATRRVPRRAPRAVFNPAARRRSAALLSLAGGLLGGLIAAALLTGGGSARGARDRRSAPAASGPAEVPLVVGESTDVARARLRALHLRVRTRALPAPGIRPGTVTEQKPAGGHSVPAGGTVHLSVAEVPRWRTVATFATRSSRPLGIRGARWRLLVSASGTSHCSWLVFCHSAQLRVLRGAAGSSTLRTLSLSDEVRAPVVLRSGPGVYRVRVDPASGDTRWSIEVQDDY